MTDTVVRQLPVDDLVKPHHDVRQGRDQDGLDSLARSLERSGQLHAIMVYPEPVELDAETMAWEDLGLEDRIDLCDVFRVVDGWSRTLAARDLNWPTIRAEIWPDEPDNQTVASLEANTTRLEMSDYETVRALKDYYESSGMTQAEVAEEAGISRSRLSQLFSLLEGYPPAVEEWADPDSHVTASHVQVIEQLDQEKAKELTYQDMMNYQRSADLLQEVAQNARQQVQAQGSTGEDGEDPASQAQAQARKANQSNGVPIETEAPTCLVTGQEADRKKAIPVCAEAYGLLQQLEETGTPLIEAVDQLQGQDVPGQPEPEA